MNQNERPWSFPVAVDEIPETGRHYDIAADDSARAAIAALAGVEAVPDLVARFDLARFGQAGLAVTGVVCAHVDQLCVLTLEPMRSAIEEPIDLTFLPQEERAAEASHVEAPIEEEGPEPLLNGAVDLGALATEFFILGIDPYPRKPGAVFEPPGEAQDPSAHPFAALAALKRTQAPGDK